ncbi:hypothetical protein [uncultured Chitinophaga sp.]|jgi:hypothetical protein|uniref:hypothetical protein n=1 Tax=uncultured Chitinophaga sp. TaxID=339340 RepID=UPI002603384E|nr:hypothetical protein [uncultured Chitinophaga sp.]
MNMNMENIEKDSLVLVLNDFTEQYKEMAKQFNDLRNTISLLEAKTADFEKKLENLQVTFPAMDTATIQTIVSQGMRDVKKMVAEQPRNILQSKRYLFFPEHNAREYYSVVLRWILYIIIASYCYLLLKHMMDHWLV